MSDVQHLKSNAYFTPHPSRAIRESPYGVWCFFGLTQVRHCELNIIFIVVLEHFLLVCKRKRSQKKSTRAVPARHPTALPQHQPSLPQEAARHMRPQTRFRSDSAGLCGRLCRPSPRRSQEVPPFALRLVGVGAPICSWDFLGGQFVNRPYEV